MYLVDTNVWLERLLDQERAEDIRLWDKIVGIFESEKAMLVRKTIEESRGRTDRSNATTGELIKWAHFLGAIDNYEWSDLIDFNKKRNDIIHGHGQWWHFDKKHREALYKGIRFLEKNDF